MHIVYKKKKKKKKENLTSDVTILVQMVDKRNQTIKMRNHITLCKYTCI